jgi:hypothetical protein
VDDGEPDTAGRTVGTAPRPGPVAFVLGGGGLLGASEIGMLRALFEAGRRPDLVVGTSVGALNGALVAADPTPASLDRLAALWRSMSTNEVFSVGLARLRDVARHRTHLHPITPLRDLVDRELGHARIEDLAVPFQCCAASIERAAETWFSSGPVSAAVTASCAVPGTVPAGPDRRRALPGRRDRQQHPGRAGDRAGCDDGVRAPRRPHLAAADGADAAVGRSRWSRSRSPGGTGSRATWRRCRTASPFTCCPPGTS